MRLNDYKIWIFDLDGTLYRQAPLRAEMALRLSAYYFLRPWRLSELLLIREYRAAREKFFLPDEENFGRLDRKYKLPSEKIINEWMIERALPAVRRWRRKKILSAIDEHRRAGDPAIVYSDYPVEKKLRSMGLTVDHEFWSGDPLIDCLKPEARGLNNIIERLNLLRAEILYVGDRDDRDGEGARRAGVAYLDVKDFERRLNS